MLVPFPSKEVRSPAFVTRSVRDVATGRVVLCVYLPYCPLPTAGLLLTVPEEEVTELNWDVNEAMQAIISFGLSTPGTITFHGRPAGPLPAGGLGTSPEVSQDRAPSP